MSEKWDGFITLDGFTGLYEVSLYYNKKEVTSAKDFDTEGEAVAWLKERKNRMTRAAEYGTRKVEL